MKTTILFGLVLGALSAAGKVFFAEVGQKVIMGCGVSSFSSRVLWSHNTQTVRVFSKRTFPSKGNSPIADRAKNSKEPDLEISNVYESDFGEFTCSVDNVPYQHVLIVFSVHVNPSGALQVGTNAALECRVNSPGNAAVAKWKTPSGVVESSPKVDLKPADSSHRGNWGCEVSYEGKTVTKIVTIDVKDPDPEPTTASIKKDTVNPKKGQNSTGGVSNWSGNMVLLGLIWWVWVAIGAGGLVVIILIVVVIIVYKRNKRRKTKFLRMKKTQLSQNPRKYCQCVRQTAAAKPQQGRRREKPSALPLQPLLQE